MVKLFLSPRKGKYVKINQNTCMTTNFYCIPILKSKFKTIFHVHKKTRIPFFLEYTLMLLRRKMTVCLSPISKPPNYSPLSHFFWIILALSNQKLKSSKIDQVCFLICHLLNCFKEYSKYSDQGKYTLFFILPDPFSLSFL